MLDTYVVFSRSAKDRGEFIKIFMRFERSGSPWRPG